MNIYTLKKDGEFHIGKRWANGVWCWDCKVRTTMSLHYFCKKDSLELKADPSSFTRSCPKCKVRIGEIGIANNQYKTPEGIGEVTKFSCPECGQSKWTKEMGYNPVFRELGFDKTESYKKRGIDGASAWSWCTDSETGLATSVGEIKKKLNKLKKVRTEYGEVWSLKKFYQMFEDIIEQTESPYNFT